MSAELLLREFERVSDSPDAMVRLRRFVLDLAVRGKLTEQLATDEPASTLVSALALARTKLRAPQYPQPLGNGDTPFAVPTSWEWVRLGEAFEYDAGEKIPAERLKPDGWLVDLEDIESDTGTVLSHVTVGDRESLSTKSEFEPGDVLYGKLRPYLNKVVVAHEGGYSTTEIVAIRSFIPMCPEFTCLALRRPDFVDYVTRLGQGTKMPRLRTQDALVAPFPLPPLDEQRRIVAIVNDLMSLCDQLEVVQKERELQRDALRAVSVHYLTSTDRAADRHKDVRFFLDTSPRLITKPSHIAPIRQAILDLAVRGRLVPQDPGDEPAAELLLRLRSNANGVVAGDLRSQSEPFHLPTGWEWVRFPELGKFGRGKSKHRPRNDPVLYAGGLHPFIQTGDVARSGGLIRTFGTLYNDTGLAQSQMWPAGTLCITIAANIADSGVLTFDACFPDSVVGLIVSSEFTDCRYFEYFLRTAKADLHSFAPSTAQKNINLSILRDVMIPLPPLKELNRIVARVDELMAVCDQLEAALESAQWERGKLLEALLYDSLGEGGKVLASIEPTTSTV
jgi:type I restriction enzyme S subunit